MGRYTFSDCRNLTSVKLPINITSVKLYTFNNCPSLTSIIIPDNVTSIEVQAFSFCTSLTLIVPNSVTSIEMSAFAKVPQIYYNGPATGAPWGALKLN